MAPASNTTGSGRMDPPDHVDRALRRGDETCLARVAPAAGTARHCREQIALRRPELREPRPVLEQPALAGEAATVAGETLVGADHAMAGDHDRDRVLVVGETDRARGLRLADPFGDLSVGARLGVGNLEQRLPDRALE